MNGIGRLRRFLAVLPVPAVLAILAAALLVAGTTTPAALAVTRPPGPPVGPPPSARVPVHTALTGNMPTWQFIVIALGAALLAVIAAGSPIGRRQRRAPRPPRPPR